MDHVAADQPQQHKRAPGRDGVDKALELYAQHIARKRHNPLKHAKPRAHDQHIAPANFAHGQPLADCHGERVHRQPHGQQQKLPQSH